MRKFILFLMLLMAASCGRGVKVTPMPLFTGWPA